MFNIKQIERLWSYLCGTSKTVVYIYFVKGWIIEPPPYYIYMPIPETHKKKHTLLFQGYIVMIQTVHFD